MVEKKTGCGILLVACFITARKRSLGQGNVLHLSVCHSVRGVGGGVVLSRGVPSLAGGVILSVGGMKGGSMKGGALKGGSMTGGAMKGGP